MAERRTGLQIGQDEEKRVKEALGVGAEGDTRTYETKEYPESPKQYTPPIPNAPKTKKSTYTPKKVKDATKAAKEARLADLSQRAAAQKTAHQSGSSNTGKKQLKFVSDVGLLPDYRKLSPQQKTTYNEAFQAHQVEHGEEPDYDIKQAHSHAQNVVRRGNLKSVPSTPGTPPEHLSQLQRTSYNIAYNAQSKYLAPESAHTVAMSAAEDAGEKASRKAESERLRAQNVRPMALNEVQHSPTGSPDTKFSSSEQDYIRINTDVRQAADRHGEHSREQHEQWSKEEILRHRNTTSPSAQPTTSKPQSAKDRVAAQEAAEASSGIPRVTYKGKNHYPPGTTQYTSHEQNMINSGVEHSMVELRRSAAADNAKKRAQREERKQGMGQDYNLNHIEAQKAVRDYQLAPSPEPTPAKEEPMATIDPIAQAKQRTAERVASRRGRPPRTAATSAAPIGKTKLPESETSKVAPNPSGLSNDTIDTMIASARAGSKRTRTKKPATAAAKPQTVKPEVPQPEAAAPKVATSKKNPSARERGFTKHPTIDIEPETPQVAAPEERTGATPPVSSPDVRAASKPQQESFGSMINRVNKTEYKPSKPVESFGSMINRTNKVADNKAFNQHADEAMSLANSGRSSSPQSAPTQPARTSPRYAKPNTDFADLADQARASLSTSKSPSEHPSYLGTLPTKEGHHVYSSNSKVYAVPGEHSNIAHGHVAAKIGGGSTSEFHANMRSIPDVKEVSRSHWEQSRGPSLIGKSRSSTGSGPLAEPDPHVQAARKALSDREPLTSAPRQSSAGKVASRAGRRFSMNDLPGNSGPSGPIPLSRPTFTPTEHSAPKLQPQQFGGGESKPKGIKARLQNRANKILDKYGDF